MRKNADLELLSFIDDCLFNIEYTINNKTKIQEIIKEIRIKMYRYRTTRMKTTQKINTNIIKMLYSEDIERLFNAGFTDTQIATITGVPVKEIQDYLKRKEL